jgi:RimJ/RimL family protein N-acetyltransferase
MSAPSERIALRDFVLRRWTNADAPSMLTAVHESFDHLHPWMPWAAERPSLRVEQEFIARTSREWADGTTFAYAIFDPSESTLLGSVGLHGRVGPGGWEIGYWVHVDHTGRGIATTSAAVLTGVALSFPGTERVEIHCDETNAASAAVPARLGYRLDRVQDAEKTAPSESGKQMIWIMTRAAYRGSEAERRAH